MIQVSVSDFAWVAIVGSGFSPLRPINFGEWCQREAERIRAKGVRAEVRKDPMDGRIALYADTPGAGKAADAAQEPPPARCDAPDGYLPPQGAETPQGAPEGIS